MSHFRLVDIQRRGKKLDHGGFGAKQNCRIKLRLRQWGALMVLQWLAIARCLNAKLLAVKLNLTIPGLLGMVITVVLAAVIFSTFSLIVACIVKTRERFMGIGQALTMPLFFAMRGTSLTPRRFCEPPPQPPF